MSTATAQKPKGEWLSISEIGKRCGIHRQTCAARLEDLGYEPDDERSTPKNKVYWFDDEMKFAVKAAKDELSAAKIRDARATYQLKELKLAEQRSELIPRVEVIEISQSLIGAMYKEFAVHQPKRLAARLAKCKTAAEVSKLMKTDTEKFMAKLQGNFEDVLK
jgi:hypothetical protein